MAAIVSAKVEVEVEVERERERERGGISTGLTLTHAPPSYLEPKPTNEERHRPVEIDLVRVRRPDVHVRICHTYTYNDWVGRLANKGGERSGERSRHRWQ
jgi:hypothetical protein